MIDFAISRNMATGSTLFHHKITHKETRRSPDESTSNQIDHVITDSPHTTDILDAKSCRGADCDSMRHRGLRYHITSLMMKTEMVLETSGSFIHLTRLITGEDFTVSYRRESFRSYTIYCYLLFTDDGPVWAETHVSNVFDGFN
jgi:hypothetical protein